MNMRNILIITLITACGSMTGAGAAERFFHKSDGSHTVPVHKIPLTDEDGQSIIAGDSHAMPFSPRTTCGLCHDYGAISGGWHFNAADNKTPAGRPGEPWVLVDEPTGTQIPLSSRGWPGLWKPEQLGITPWKFTKLFARNTPGGGISEPTNTLEDVEARWEVSGKLEINCLICHTASPRQDMTEWTKQIARENFRWAATAASGLGDVGGMASRVRDSWSLIDGPNPDDRQYAVPPSVNYTPQCFDGKRTVFFDLADRPADNRCQHCHSVAPAGSGRNELEPDVHTAAGLKCVDCHNNNISHGIDRGQEGDHSCRGCHLVSNTYRAPKPLHKGLPPHHLEKLTCTACHSGPGPDDQLTVVRTSRANRLGIYGKAVWDTTLPHIVEPVFVENAAGKIEPRRMMWPAFWAQVDGTTVTPLPPETIIKAGAGILDAAQQVARVLQTLQGAIRDDGSDEAVFTNALAYAAGGKLYQPNPDQGLLLAGPLAQAPGPWVCQANGGWASTVPAFDAAKYNPDENEADAKARDAIKGAFTALKAIAPEGATPVLLNGGKVFACDTNETLAALAQPTAPAGLDWAWLQDNRIIPLVPDTAGRFVTQLVGTDRMLTEEAVTTILGKLGPKSGYVANGKLFQRDSAGKLVSSDHAAAAPVSWPLGHAVRPATKALGAKQCTDCHSQDSRFFFSNVTALGPLKTERPSVTPMYQFEKQPENFNRLFGISFAVRPLFKMVVMIAALVSAIVLLLYVMLALRRQTEGRSLVWLQRASLAVTALSGAGLGIAGFMETVYPGTPLIGYPVMIRMSLVGLFAVSLASLALLRASEHGFHHAEARVTSVWQRIFFWALIISGLVTVTTMLLSMVPLLGTSGQHAASLTHQISSIVMVLATLCYGICAAHSGKKSAG